jgi:hypothetical protein
VDPPGRVRSGRERLSSKPAGRERLSSNLVTPHASRRRALAEDRAEDDITTRLGGV